MPGSRSVLQGGRLLVSVVLALPSCWGGEQCTAPTLELAFKVDSATYYSVADGWQSSPAAFPSYATNVPKQLVVDRQAGVVRVSYWHDGKTVVETWTIAGSVVR